MTTYLSALVRNLHNSQFRLTHRRSDRFQLDYCLYLFNNRRFSYLTAQRKSTAVLSVRIVSNVFGFEIEINRSQYYAVLPADLIHIEWAIKRL